MGKDKEKEKKKKHKEAKADGTGFQQLDVELRLALKPYFLRNIDEGVHAELSQQLFKYVPSFGGSPSSLLPWSRDLPLALPPTCPPSLALSQSSSFENYLLNYVLTLFPCG